MSIRLESSRKRLIVCLFDHGPGHNLIRVDFLELGRPASISHGYMLDIGSTPDTKLKISGTVTLPIGMSKSHTSVNFGES